MAPLPEFGPVRQALEVIPTEYDWKGSDDIFTLPWFTRLWCIQEIALPLTTELYYGSHNISWEDLSGAIYIQWRGVILTHPANVRLAPGFT
jgi:hypothetical protein